MKKILEALPEVQTVVASSREKELSDFRIRHQDNALLVQSLEEVGNPFGARLNIQAKDPTQYENIVRFLGGENSSSGLNRSIIDQITYKKDIVDRLLSMVNAVNKVGLIVSIILVCLSILVTFNTISLAIYISREEISVMRLVGADDNYVTGPFIIEGIIAGIISSFLSIGLLYPLTLWITKITSGVYGGINLLAYYIENFAQIFLILLGSGVFLGIVSSYLAIRRYLKA